MKLRAKFEFLPRVVRQAAVTVLGFRNCHLRYKHHYQKTLAFLQRSASWEGQEQLKWQKARLDDLLRCCLRNVPNFRNYESELLGALNANDLNSTLAVLPTMAKETLRLSPEQVCNRDVKQLISTSTSGSTGAPVSIGHDLHSIQRRFAFLHDHLSQVGVNPFDRTVRLSGRVFCRSDKIQSKPWLLNTAENQLFLSTYHLNRAHSKQIATFLRKFSPVYLDGYVSGVVELLKLLELERVKLGSLRAIITTAETLTPEARRLIEELSGLPVLDYYSASEGLPLIQQCSHGVYHVRWQSGIFEVATGEGFQTEGDGELVATSFVQDRTPLVRYRTGDLVRGLEPTGSSNCKCGLRTPTVKEILGRVEDNVYTKDGRSIGMFTYRTLKEIRGLGETQVIQHQFDEFEVRSVIRPQFDLSEVARQVKESFERTLGYSISLNIRSVNELERGPNGKIRLVISRVGRHPE